MADRPNRPMRPRGGAGGPGRGGRVVIDTGAARPRQDGRQQRDRTDQRPKQPREVVPPTGPVTVESGVTVRDLSQALGVQMPELIKILMGLGQMRTATQSLSDEEVELIATELKREITIKHVGEEDEEPEAYDDAEEDLAPRPPVVTIMGHVDHGKTTLLDAIRETAVVETEAGGITQHIGAYQVDVGGRKVTFLDTPGHEAFTAMRARGAKVTDIAVLVVAADDSVMPQTRESISHARAAEVPIVVAVNKIDLPDANPDRVKSDLASEGLQPEDWGGETQFALVSAKQKLNLDDLLERILLVADAELERVVENEREARQLAQRRGQRLRTEQLAQRSKGGVSLESLFSQLQEGAVQDLNLILKGDVGGSVEAAVGELAKIEHPEVRVNVIHQGVGAITEGDIMLAATSNALVVGFNVRPNTEARQLAEREGVDIRTYRVIYQLTEDIEQALVGMLSAVRTEETIGEAEVRQLFRVSRLGTIAGSYVTNGVVRRNAKVRVVRDGTVIYDTSISQLKRFKDDVREVEEGFECGILLDGFNDVKEGDVLEVFETKQVERTDLSAP